MKSLGQGRIDIKMLVNGVCQWFIDFVSFLGYLILRMD